MTKTGQFFDEFIGSSILMFLIYALKDDDNIGAGNLTPLGLFFIIFGIGRRETTALVSKSGLITHPQVVHGAGRLAMPLISPVTLAQD